MGVISFEETGMFGWQSWKASLT